MIIAAGYIIMLASGLLGGFVCARALWKLPPAEKEPQEPAAYIQECWRKPNRNRKKIFQT